MVKLRHLALIGICWLMAGCSSGGASHDASPSAQPSLTPTSQTAAFLTPIVATTVWPNLQVNRITDAINDNEHLIFQSSATPDGRFVLVKLQSRYNPGYGPNIPEQVALYETATGKIKVIGSAHDNQHGVTGIVADNHWVAWYERGLPEISTEATWTLYAYNMDTAITKVITQNAQGNGIYPQMQLDQGQLIWSDTTGPATLDRAAFVIRLMNLATGATQTIAQRAGSPVISWPWVGWSQVTSSDASQGVEQFKNMVTGSQVTLPVMSLEKVLVGTALIYIDHNRNNSFTYIPDIQQGQAKSLAVYPADFTINGITFNGRYVGWHSGDNRAAPVVYDVQQHQLIQLPVQYRPNGTETTFVAGNHLIWGEDPNSDAAETGSYQNEHKAPPSIYGIVNLQST